MKKSLLNIKHFVDSNVRNRIHDRSSNNDTVGDSLTYVEKSFDELRQVCIDAEKKITSQLQSNQSPSSSTLSSYYNATINSTSINANGCANNSGPIQSINYKSSTIDRNNKLHDAVSNVNNHYNNDSCNNDQAREDGQTKSKNRYLSQGIETIKRHKKLPIISFNRFLVKSSNRLKPDSLLSTTFCHCSSLQSHLAQLYLNYEHNIEQKCLQPLNQMLEHDIPTVLKCRKSYIKANNDLESIKAKYNGLNNKQQQHQHPGPYNSNSSYNVNSNVIQQSVLTKLDQLKKELDDATNRYNQAKDVYVMELFGFISREQELVNLFVQFYQIQAQYHQQAALAINSSMPTIDNLIKNTPRRPVFGTSLSDHVRVTGRELSIVVELCVMLLTRNALNEEGLFRISASSTKIKKLKNAIDAWHVNLASEADIHASNNRLNIRNGSQSSATGDTPTVPTMVDLLIKDITSQDEQILADSHTIAGVLKLHLRELPEPLLTYQLNEQWIEAAKISDTKLRLQALWNCCQLLPKVNYVNLRHLIRLLAQITCHSKTNKMSSTNLAIAVAPSLIWSANFSTSTTTTTTTTTTITSNTTAAAATIMSNNGHNSCSWNTTMDNSRAVTTATQSATSGFTSGNVVNNVGADSNSSQQQHYAAGDNINLQQQQQAATVDTMSNVNLSTSLHVSIIDNLIYYADWFFPPTNTVNNNSGSNNSNNNNVNATTRTLRDIVSTITKVNYHEQQHQRQQVTTIQSATNSCSSPSPSSTSMASYSSSSNSSLSNGQASVNTNSINGTQTVQKPSRSYKCQAPQIPRKAPMHQSIPTTTITTIATASRSVTTGGQINSPVWQNKSAAGLAFFNHNNNNNHNNNDAGDSLPAPSLATINHMNGYREPTPLTGHLCASPTIDNNKNELSANSRTCDTPRIGCPINELQSSSIAPAPTTTTTTTTTSSSSSSSNSQTSTMSRMATKSNLTSAAAHSSRPTVPPPNRPTKQPDECPLSNGKSSPNNEMQHLDNNCSPSIGRKNKRPMSAIISSISAKYYHQSSTTNKQQWRRQQQQQQQQQQQEGNNRQQMTIDDDNDNEGRHHNDNNISSLSNQNVGKSISSSISDVSSIINDKAFRTPISPTSISLDTTDEDDDITSVSDNDDSSFDDDDEDEDDALTDANQLGDIIKKNKHPSKAISSTWSGSVSDLSFNAMTISSPSRSDLPIASSVSPLSSSSRDANNDDTLSVTLTTQQTDSVARIVTQDATQQQETSNTIKSQPPMDASIKSNDSRDNFHKSSSSTVLLVKNESNPLNAYRSKVPTQSTPTSESINSCDDNQLQNTVNGIQQQQQDCTTIVYCGSPPIKPPRGANTQVANNQSTPL